MATTAVTTSSSFTANPASRSVPARSARVFVVVFVIRRNGCLVPERPQRVHRAGKRLPRDGEHAVDVQQEPSIVTFRSVPLEPDPEGAPETVRGTPPLAASRASTVLVGSDVAEPRGQERTREPEDRERGRHRRSPPGPGRTRTPPAPDQGACRTRGAPPLEDGPPLGLAWRLEEQLGDAPRRVGHQQLTRRHDVRDVGVEGLDRGRDPSRGSRTSSAASICSSWNRWRPRASSRPTVSRSNSSALWTRHAWTQEQLRIEGVVRPPRDVVDAVDPPVDLVDPGRRGLRLALRPERDRVLQDERPLQPLPRVPPRTSRSGSPRRSPADGRRAAASPERRRTGR